MLFLKSKYWFVKEDYEDLQSLKITKGIFLELCVGLVSELLHISRKFLIHSVCEHSGNLQHLVVISQLLMTAISVNQLLYSAGLGMSICRDIHLFPLRKRRGITTGLDRMNGASYCILGHCICPYCHGWWSILLNMWNLYNNCSHSAKQLQNNWGMSFREWSTTGNWKGWGTQQNWLQIITALCVLPRIAGGQLSAGFLPFLNDSLSRHFGDIISTSTEEMRACLDAFLSGFCAAFCGVPCKIVLTVHTSRSLNGYWHCKLCKSH